MYINVNDDVEQVYSVVQYLPAILHTVFFPERLGGGRFIGAAFF